MTGRIPASAAVLAQLRQAIATGELAPGQQVVQESLAAQFGVSRVPLREALQVLEGEGQVVHEPNRGYFITELSMSDLVEVYRLRALLEAEAVRTGLANLTSDDIDELQSLLCLVDQAADASDVSAMIAANRRFHFLLFEAAALPRLTRMIASLWDATEVYRSVYYGADLNRERVSDEHSRIMTAITSGDVESVIEELDAHREHAIHGISALVLP
jgi:DNA-binding GntR family transcriptional regulator